MHFYEFNIGDYAKKTQHLTNGEDLAYRRALDLYYDTEKPLEITHGLATLSRRLRVDEKDLQNVINEFFPDGRNQHADEKIAAYYAFLERQKENGRRGGRPKTKEEKPSGIPSVSQNNPVPSQPLTTKPLTTKPLTNIKPSAEYSDEFEQAWSAYPRFGDTNKKASYKAWNARLNAGVDPEQIIAGVKRYAVYCHANGTEQKFIKQPQTFFGSDKHYENAWPVHKSHSPPRKTSVQEARLDTIKQIFGGVANGNDGKTIDVTPTGAIEGNRASIPEARIGIRQSDGG